MNTKTTPRAVDDATTPHLQAGCRIPQDFFITKGTGESDIAIHAGSYHLALRKAGIELCNIITYSSILPRIANEIKRPKTLTHGSVMETIMAVSTAEKGQRASTGITFGWLHDKKSGERYGGLVCEYNGDLPAEEVQKTLRQSLDELYHNGYSEAFDLRDITHISESFVPKKKFGTALVALCFTTYQFPLLSKVGPS